MGCLCSKPVAAVRYDREVGDASPGAASPVAPAPPGDVQASLDGLKQCLEEQSSNKGDTAELLDCTLKAMGEALDILDPPVAPPQQQQSTPAPKPMPQRAEMAYDVASTWLEPLKTVGNTFASSMKDWSKADTEAWARLGSRAATDLLSAGAGVVYIGPVLALFGFAIKQWSTYSKMPDEAKKLLRSCKQLLEDIRQPWQHIQGTAADERLQRFIQALGGAAAMCIGVSNRGIVKGVALAQVDKDDLAAKALCIDQLRAELNTVLLQAGLGQGARIEALVTTVAELIRPPPPLPHVELSDTVGIDDSVKRYASELLGSGRTVALLLYGMGGVGKSTLAQKLHDTLRNSGQFTGGTFEVTVQRQFYVGVSSHGTAQLAQQRLLASVLRHEATCTRSAAAAELDLVSGLSMDQGRAQLEAAFKKTTAPVLLKVDNIPEDNPGIQGMLPDNLLNLLPDRSMVLFTSRNKAAQGLPPSTRKEPVRPLTVEPARQLLMATGLELSEQQQQDVLGYCGGVPLALKLVRGALEADPDNMQSVLRRLKQLKPISINARDELMAVVGYSVEVLGQEAREAFYDIAVLLREDLRWRDLQALYGADAISNLQTRSLLSTTGGNHDIVGFTDVVATVHDLLLTYAHNECGPRGDNYRAWNPGLGKDCWEALRAGQTVVVNNLDKLVGVNGTYGWLGKQWELPVSWQPSERLRVLKVNSPSHEALESLAFKPGTRVLLLYMTWWTKDEADCGGPERLPESLFANLDGMCMLYLSRSNINCLPGSLFQLSQLRHLVLECCWALERLPGNLGGLVSLEGLTLRYCKQLVELPATITQLYNLQLLEIANCQTLIERGLTQDQQRWLKHKLLKWPYYYYKKVQQRWLRHQLFKWPNHYYTKGYRYSYGFVYQQGDFPAPEGCEADGSNLWLERF